MKNRLYVITLEPLEERYTAQWYSYWKKEFSKYYDVKYIDGKYDNKGIEKGRFLDVNKTNRYKAQQIEIISNLFYNRTIKKDDTFIFMDSWHYGITALKYMSQLNKINVKIYGFWHAGTWDEYDFITQAGLKDWACLNEAGWMLACDGHFVATQFHKDMIIESLGMHQWMEENMYVVGFPMDWETEIKAKVKKRVEKKDIIVFPHRLDDEKCPEVFNYIAKCLERFQFIKTMSEKRTKKQYYNLMNKAKVVFSASRQETYGIGIVEALMLDCIPVVPNRLSYVELYPKEFRYENIVDARRKVKKAITKYSQYRELIDTTKRKIQKQSLESIDKMAEVMLK